MVNCIVPSIIYSNGDREYHKEGKLHRDGGPAVEKVDGTKKWYIDGFFKGMSVPSKTVYYMRNTYHQ